MPPDPQGSVGVIYGQITTCLDQCSLRVFIACLQHVASEMGEGRRLKKGLPIRP